MFPPPFVAITIFVLIQFSRRAESECSSSSVARESVASIFGEGVTLACDLTDCSAGVGRWYDAETGNALDSCNSDYCVVGAQGSTSDLRIYNLTGDMLGDYSCVCSGEENTTIECIALSGRCQMFAGAAGKIRVYNGRYPRNGEEAHLLEVREGDTLNIRCQEDAILSSDCGTFRDDHRCGGNYLAPNGKMAECDPNGEYPCCSPYNWCGITADHCNCDECVDYRGTFRDDIRCGGSYLAPNGKMAGCDPNGEYPCCSAYNWCGNTADHCNCDECVDYSGTFRDDIRCGGSYLAPNGKVAECDPNGEYPCCSAYNWCGNTADHCDCDECADYRGHPNSSIMAHDQCDHTCTLPLGEGHEPCIVKVRTVVTLSTTDQPPTTLELATSSNPLEVSYPETTTSPMSSGISSQTITISSTSGHPSSPGLVPDISDPEPEPTLSTTRGHSPSPGLVPDIPVSEPAQPTLSTTSGHPSSPGLLPDIPVPEPEPEPTSSPVTRPGGPTKTSVAKSPGTFLHVTPVLVRNWIMLVTSAVFSILLIIVILWRFCLIHVERADRGKPDVYHPKSFYRSPKVPNIHVQGDQTAFQEEVDECTFRTNDRVTALLLEEEAGALNRPWGRTEWSMPTYSIRRKYEVMMVDAAIVPNSPWPAGEDANCMES